MQPKNKTLIIHRAVNIFLNILILLLFAAEIIALSGGASFRLFDILSISSHNPFPPIAYLIVIALLKFWFSAPNHLTKGEKIDYLMAKIHKRLNNLAISTDPKTLKPLGRLLKIIGICIQETEITLDERRLIPVIIANWTIMLFLFSIFRYLNFGNNTDLCIFIEAMDSATKGELFTNTFHFLELHTLNDYLNSDTGKATMFAIHFRPLLFLFVPFYKIAQTPITLFILSSLIIGSSVWPLYQLSKYYLKNKKRSLALTACYCLNPLVLNSAKAFLPETFSISFILWAIWFSINRRYVLMTLMLILTLASKEILALPVLSFGAFLFFFRKEHVMGVVISVLSLFYLYACINWIIPSFMQGADYLSISRLYSNFGTSFTDVVKSAIISPWKMAPYLFSTATVKYFFKLLFPLAFVPILGWRVFLLNAPVLLQNLLAGEPGDNWYRNVWAHWSSPLVPFTFLSVMYGFRFIANKTYVKGIKNIFVLIIIASTFSSLMAMPQFSDMTLKNAVKTFKSIAPENSSVSTNIIEGWGAMRLKYDLQIFPKNAGNSDYIFVITSLELVKKFAPDKNQLTYSNVPKIQIEKQAEKFLYYSSIFYDHLENDATLYKIWERNYPNKKYLITIYGKKSPH